MISTSWAWLMHGTRLQASPMNSHLSLRRTEAVCVKMVQNVSFRCWANPAEAMEATSSALFAWPSCWSDVVCLPRPSILMMHFISSSQLWVDEFVKLSLPFAEGWYTRRERKLCTSHEKWAPLLRPSLPIFLKGRAWLVQTWFVLLLLSAHSTWEGVEEDEGFSSLVSSHWCCYSPV